MRIGTDPFTGSPVGEVMTPPTAANVITKADVLASSPDGAILGVTRFR
jgi:hypothetical protein